MEKLQLNIFVQFKIWVCQKDISLPKQLLKMLSNYLYLRNKKDQYLQNFKNGKIENFRIKNERCYFCMFVCVDLK